MGKPFAKELARLAQTLRVATRLPLGELPRQVQAASAGSVILIGTGGSLTSAEFGRQLFDYGGAIAQAGTTLEFIQSRARLRGTSVFLLSASGNNKDVLAAFREGCDREAARIVVVCASRSSKLARLTADCERASSFEFALPSGRDGYLATNSLLATCAVLTRAFGKPILSAQDVAPLLEHGREIFLEAFSGSRLPHCVILYSGWGKPAAVDLESKLSEAGLAASMLADFRHFAHGRHNWLDKQKTATAVICFSTPEDERLALATLANVPSAIPICHFHTSLTGASGGLELLLKSFGFVNEAGVAAGIDPGRPGVPAYGSKLYHLGPIGIQNHAKPRVQNMDLAAAVERKLPVASFGVDHCAAIHERGAAFLSRLYAASFGSLVADFDGTILPPAMRDGPIPKLVVQALMRLLKSGIPLFLATGRGDSVHEILLKTVPRALRHMVHIGYFNGAFCLPLSETEKFSQHDKRFPELDKFEKCLRSHTEIHKLGEVKNKGWQITIKVSGNVNVNGLLVSVQEQLEKFGNHSLRVVVSSHSIDLIPASVSKASCLRLAECASTSKLEVLAIGDRGAYPGNDFELLRHPFSLSVDSVSTDADTCWNLLPRGMSHTQGTAFYLSRLAIRQGRFNFVP